MNILQNFWRYWKWLCVALMTTFVVLALAAAVINHFKSAPAESGAEACIESGGTCDEGGQFCMAPA